MHLWFSVRHHDHGYLLANGGGDIVSASYNNNSGCVMAGNRSGSGWWLTLFFLFVPGFGAASEAFSSSHKKMEWRLGFAQLNGESGEYVYDANGAFTGIPGYKVSQLDWQLNSVPVLGIGATVHMDERLRLNFDYWKNTVTGDGTMDDYDWLYLGQDWSDWSHHDNTSVDEVSRLDFGGEFQLYDSTSLVKSIHGVVGFRRDRFAWESIGGYGIYSDLAYRDTLVSFPNVPVISYQQTFSAPYLGVNIQSAGDVGVPLLLTLGLRYSPLARGEDVDIHHLRSLRFETVGRNGTWYGADIKLDFIIDDRSSVELGYFNQRYNEILGSMMITDLTTGARAYYGGNAAGLDHSSSMFSLGIKHEF